MRRTLLSMDLWTGEHSEVFAGKPRERCAVCGLHKFRHLDGEGRPHITLCGRNSVQIHEHSRPVDFAQLAARLRPLGDVRWNSMLLRFAYGDYTLSVFADGRTVVQGTSEVRACTRPVCPVYRKLAVSLFLIPDKFAIRNTTCSLRFDIPCEITHG